MKEAAPSETADRLLLRVYQHLAAARTCINRLPQPPPPGVAELLRYLNLGWLKTGRILNEEMRVYSPEDESPGRKGDG